jgi:hypothetical protein
LQDSGRRNLRPGQDLDGPRIYFQGMRGLKFSAHGGAGVVITGYLEP